MPIERPDRAGDNPELDAMSLADGTLMGALRFGPREPDATIVLVHGWTQDHTSWDDVTDRLRSEHPELGVVAYDGEGTAGQTPDRGAAPRSTSSPTTWPR